MFAASKVSRPEDDRRVKQLTRERDVARHTIEEAGRAIALGRRRLDQIAGAATAPGADIDGLKAEARGESERIRKAEDDRAKAKESIKELDVEIGKARRQAAAKIARDLAPRVNKATAAVILPELRLYADAIAAVAVLRPAVDGATLRRVPLSGMAIPENLVSYERRFAALRSTTEKALAAGAIKAGDIPKQVRECWGLG